MSCITVAQVPNFSPTVADLYVIMRKAWVQGIARVQGYVTLYSLGSRVRDPVQQGFKAILHTVDPLH